MKIVSLILAALFFVSTALQFNDPDPLFWIALWGVSAFIALFAAFNKCNPWIILFVLAVSAYKAFQLFPAFITWVSSGAPSIVESMSAESEYIEKVREFLGLLIIIASMTFFYIRTRQSYMHRQNAKSGL
jgi:Transmembrane family 220, helix